MATFVALILGNVKNCLLGCWNVLLGKRGVAVYERPWMKHPLSKSQDKTDEQAEEGANEGQKEDWLSVICLFNNLKLSVFNIYLPCDNVHNEGNLCTYQDVLNEVKFLMFSHNRISHVVACDLNTDVSRQHSSHTIALQEFCEYESLQMWVIDKPFNIDYTNENVATGVCSTINHFMVSHNLHRCIIEYFT